MKKILLTGFEPFGGDKINPSWEVAKAITKKRIPGARIFGLRLPVVYGLEVKRTIGASKRYKPDIIISLGQDNGASVIKIERIGINIRQGKDEHKRQPKGEFIIKNGPPAYWATLPAKRIVSALKKHNVPAVVSYHAGTYLCNEILYALRHYVVVNKLSTKVGFIHLPRLPKQIARRKGSAPNMSLEVTVKGVKLAIQTILKNL